MKFLTFMSFGSITCETKINWIQDSRGIFFKIQSTNLSTFKPHKFKHINKSRRLKLTMHKRVQFDDIIAWWRFTFTLSIKPRSENCLTKCFQIPNAYTSGVRTNHAVCLWIFKRYKSLVLLGVTSLIAPISFKVVQESIKRILLSPMLEKRTSLNQVTKLSFVIFPDFEAVIQIIWFRKIFFRLLQHAGSIGCQSFVQNRSSR